MMPDKRCYDALVRTTVTIDDQLLAEAKLIAARTHRTIGSVLEDALRRLIADQAPVRQGERFSLPTFTPATPGLHADVDLLDTEQVAELMGDNESRALS
jgi:Arc/MetJ family transcription regulator